MLAVRRKTGRKFWADGGNCKDYSWGYTARAWSDPTSVVQNGKRKGAHRQPAQNAIPGIEHPVPGLGGRCRYWHLNRANESISPSSECLNEDWCLRRFAQRVA